MSFFKMEANQKQTKGNNHLELEVYPKGSNFVMLW